MRRNPPPATPRSPPTTPATRPIGASTNGPAAGWWSPSNTRTAKWNRRAPGERRRPVSLFRPAHLAPGMKRSFARPLHLVAAELISQACDEAGGEVDLVAAFEA